MLGVDQQAAERRVVRQCHRAHAPRARQLLRQPGEERLGFLGRIAVAYRVEGEHVQIVGIEAGIDSADVPVAGDDETGDQQQHEGRGHLGYHEEVAQAEPRGTWYRLMLGIRGCPRTVDVTFLKQHASERYVPYNAATIPMLSEPST